MCTEDATSGDGALSQRSLCHSCNACNTQIHRRSVTHEARSRAPDGAPRAQTAEARQRPPRPVTTFFGGACFSEGDGEKFITAMPIVGSTLSTWDLPIKFLPNTFQFTFSYKCVQTWTSLNRCPRLLPKERYIYKRTGRRGGSFGGSTKSARGFSLLFPVSAVAVAFNQTATEEESAKVLFVLSDK